ncbi:hypothetical protein ATKI12_1726 [Kitasatospora sp. Ki12]
MSRAERRFVLPVHPDGAFAHGGRLAGRTRPSGGPDPQDAAGRDRGEK